MKLTPKQEEALKKLTNEWQSAYSLQISMGTLNALVRRGLAQISYERGHMFFPQNHTMYKLKRHD